MIMIAISVPVFAAYTLVFHQHNDHRRLLVVGLVFFVRSTEFPGVAGAGDGVSDTIE